MIVSANYGVEPSRLVDYKQLVEQALQMCPDSTIPLRCIFYNRPMFDEVNLASNRQLYANYAKEMDTAREHDCVPVDSNAPLYLLYTSGTTGNPKFVANHHHISIYICYLFIVYYLIYLICRGVTRMTAGYMIAMKYSMSSIYGMRPGDKWWAFSGKICQPCLHFRHKSNLLYV